MPTATKIKTDLEAKARITAEHTEVLAVFTPYAVTKASYFDLARHIAKIEENATGSKFEPLYSDQGFCLIRKAK